MNNYEQSFLYKQGVIFKEYGELLTNPQTTMRDLADFALRYGIELSIQFRDAVKTKTYKLQADSVNGVMLADFDEDNYDVLGNEDFLQALEACQDGEILYGVVNQEVFDKINEEYGVRG